MKKLSAIVFAMCLMTACSGGDAAPGPSSGEPMSGESLSSQTSSGAEEEETPSGQPGQQVGNIYLYGELHGVKAIYDRELELWKDHYEKEQTRHLFLELPYYTAQYLNLWMESEDDQILEELYGDWDQTASHVEDYKTFFKGIKEECPETIFHGTDVGHQYSTTGQRYLDWLTQNGQEDSENYRLASENIEQGKQFYEAGDFVYREEKMVENFKREIAGVNGESVMGIYGGAHLGGTVSGTDIPAMASQLKELYGDKVSGEDLTMVGKEDMEPLETTVIKIGGKEYPASDFGEEDLTGMIQDIASRRFWRLEEAYEDFADAEKNGDMLPCNNYPMAVEEGQVFMIVYKKTDGEELTLFYRSDGNEWNGMLTTEGILVEEEVFR